MMKCEVCGREGRIIMNMCTQHYQQFRIHGEIPKRTERTPNHIEIYENYAEVDMYSKGKVIEKIKISLCDVNKIRDLKWGLDRIYARNSKTKILMHRYIMDAPEWKVVDHINGDTLDNRRENLRVVNPFINAVNKTKTSQRGIDKHRNKYRARIAKDKVEYFLGYFETHEDALDARKKAELELYGELFE